MIRNVDSLSATTIKRTRFWTAFSVLCIIYLTDSLLFATSTINVLTLTRRFAPVFFAAIFVVLNIRKLNKQPIIVVVLFSIFVSMVLSGRIINGYSYITQIALLLFSWGYSQCVDFDTFADNYVRFMRIIAVVSVIAFIFSSVITHLNFIPNITNVVPNTYKFLFFSNVPLSTSLARRNWGPFWEPGVYQCYLNIALVFALFRGGKHCRFDIVLFVVTALTTLSGAAILPMPFIFLAYLLSSNKKKKYSFYILVVICLVVILLVGTGYLDEILNKLFGIGSDSASMGFRIGSAAANIKAAITHPLFGASPETQDTLRSEIIYKYAGRATSGNTNTILAFFSYYGVFVGTFYAVRLFKFTKNISVQVIPRILLFAAIVLATSNENLMASILINVFLFICLSAKQSDPNCTEAISKGVYV